MSSQWYASSDITWARSSKALRRSSSDTTAPEVTAKASCCWRRKYQTARPYRGNRSSSVMS
ncbi:MAG TPA: hypothetical protein VFS43_26485 [Polyangiaceae bacterium]|nr:hypothetical protein [Polyangiaceae bacterium]